MLMWLLPVVFLCTTLHEVLQARASANYQTWFIEYGTTATVADWNVVWRAGAMPRYNTAPRNRTATAPRHAASQEQQHPVFFFDLGALSALSPVQTKTLVVPSRDETWHACVEERILSLANGQALLARCMTSTLILNGKTLTKDYELQELADATIRIRSSGLKGGMPGASDQQALDDESELLALRKKALMDRAQTLHVATKQGEGETRSWR